MDPGALPWPHSSHTRILDLGSLAACAATRIGPWTPDREPLDSSHTLEAADRILDPGSSPLSPRRCRTLCDGGSSTAGHSPWAAKRRPDFRPRTLELAQSDPALGELAISRSPERELTTSSGSWIFGSPLDLVVSASPAPGLGWIFGTPPVGLSRRLRILDLRISAGLSRFGYRKEAPDGLASGCNITTWKV